MTFLLPSIVSSSNVFSEFCYLWESRNGAVVRPFASHHCSPGLYPDPGIICWFLILVLAEIFFLQAHSIPPSLKINT